MGRADALEVGAPKRCRDADRGLTIAAITPAPTDAEIPQGVLGASLTVERYIRLSGIAPSRLGREAVKDPRFVHGLRLGREPRPKTLARVAAWLREHPIENDGR
jgi:hypothetical protein